MRVAILTDALALRREGVMLRRVAIGLVDEGASVVSIEPRSVSGVTARSIGGGLIPHLIYEDRGLWLTRVLRCDRLRRDLFAAGGAPDVVHVLGRRAWRFGLEIARRSGSALCVDVHTRGGLHRLHGFENVASATFGAESERLDATDAEPGRGAAADRRPSFAAVAADRIVAVEAAEALRRTPVHTVPWGVHRRGEWRERRSERTRPAIAVLAEFGKPDLLRGVLAGLAELSGEPMIFVDEEASADGRMWKLAGELGIRDRVDVAPSLEAHRELTLQCDVLVAPGPTGRHRSVVLDAMAAGVAVVGRRDPLVEALHRSGVAWLLEGDEPASWASALREALEGGEAARDKVATAKRFVDEERRPSQHIEGLLTVYRSLANPQAIRFQTANAPSAAR